METPINFPRVGSRVWTIPGLQNHGPKEGPFVNVSPNTGGKIVRIEKPWYAPTIGDDLYVVQWDAGLTTKHYFGEFGDVLCIGPFDTLADFELALRTATAGEVTIGPKGGFREFRAILHTAYGDLMVHAVREQARIWSYLEPLVRKAGLKLNETRLKPAIRAKREIQKP